MTDLQIIRAQRVRNAPGHMYSSPATGCTFAEVAVVHIAGLGCRA